MARLRSSALALALSFAAVVTLASCLRLIGGSKLGDDGGPPDADGGCAAWLDCDDGDDCTDDRCDAAAGECVYARRDGDGDGHQPTACGGGDCDDANRARSPDALEVCNGVDDDCDGGADEGCCTTGPCTTACETTGEQRCNPDGTYGACAPPAELCNRADDDCDGETDEGCCEPGPCVTACGSAGQIECNPDGSSRGCAPPDEACGNGVDDDCDGGADEGCCSAEPCTTACGSIGERACSPEGVPGECVPPAEACGDGADDDCDGEADEGCCAPGPCDTACGSSGTVVCNPDGSFGGCAPPLETCNGRDDDCDALCENGFACCAGATMSCVALGYDSGLATCAPGCGTWDLDGCAFCGNGRADPGEDCDGDDLRRHDCTTVPGGFDGGTLACTSGCVYDTSGCLRSWDPTGSYTLDPRITFTCAMGLVSIDLATVTLTDSGTNLAADMGRCVMRGPSALVTRSIDITCTLPGGGGGCDETYRLTGTFVDDDHWSGTMTATFVGTCLGCTNQRWDVRGARP